jgi:hypothetical protein
MIAATAVAARIVKNQYNRLPSSRNGLALRGAAFGPETTVAFRWETVDSHEARIDWLARRCGEIHGQIVWNWRLFKMPERP